MDTNRKYTRTLGRVFIAFADREEAAVFRLLFLKKPVD